MLRHVDRHRVDGPLAFDRREAYDRRSVERFFTAACERRAWLLSEIAAERRRIAEFGAALDRIGSVDDRLLEMVLDAHCSMAKEARANRKEIAKVMADAAVEAEHIATSAQARVTERVVHLPDHIRRPGRTGGAIEELRGILGVPATGRTGVRQQRGRCDAAGAVVSSAAHVRLAPPSWMGDV